MSELKRTALYGCHEALKAKIVEFGGWDMPLFYPTGIVAEHLATRKTAGMFDVSHMGRFLFRGDGALAFLQHVLTNNAQALDEGMAQYTVIPNETGGAVDDAFLYRFKEDEYLLVVNASNAEKDWNHFRSVLPGFSGVEMINATADLVMISLQGPESRRILMGSITSGPMPEPMRNYLSILNINGFEVWAARTGYTGEPLAFELFAPAEAGPGLWDTLLEMGVVPAGLGARDTLRLEAGLPLYGHEFGPDPEGRDIPILACRTARFAVSFAPQKEDYIGRAALLRQFAALKGILRRDYSRIEDLPRMIRPFAMTGRGVGRAGAKVFKDDKPVGFVTSGTTTPYWNAEGEGLETVLTGESKIRTVGLALIDSEILDDDRVAIEIRKKVIEAVIVPYHLRSEAPPYARPIVYGVELESGVSDGGDGPEKAARLVKSALANHQWRQAECINLIPSEMTHSPLARALSAADPSFRYAEHKEIRAFYESDVFFYQGTDFISEVEKRLEREFRAYLGCPEVEARLISGQMANTAVYSAMVDYINRVDRKREPRRIRMVLNNHIGKGGHLSAQPMGALRDFVARNPETERPAVVNFPVHQEDRYRIDLAGTYEMIDRYQPEMIIFGKSMVLYREPVAEIRKYVEDKGLNTVVLYDMAHVLGLIGPHFQQPFDEGADLVTGSTHKTFFGTQRGVIGSSFTEDEERWELWEAIRRRSFPGSVSNHHLGTMVGLLAAAYEMNHFKAEYQPKVIANAKAFAGALKDCGLSPAGDPGIGYTETHQVILETDYANGPYLARLLEANHIICNYQAGPDDEGFTAAGAIRMGVAEMTRFGMGEEDFGELAGLMADVIRKGADVREPVKALRSRFLDLHYCFTGIGIDDLLSGLFG